MLLAKQYGSKHQQVYGSVLLNTHTYTLKQFDLTETGVLGIFGVYFVKILPRKKADEFYKT